ncbi:hypothetical protein SAMD00019534_003830 [Acytostelium subglobosum LB1]|uniref:hypothetical protein n=1 Tax=Acytostelium subglobosum LB1 TaxID=1410327 RepID=UPI0006451F58|nr:hypothetical protein SAMD00019534_003830 [Acytostelium subglobosum LB1]GAM17208.1 hypothetical protein SAMD00019534_003830 [Acytostelium subglobosum LB1]|eukprot:XP_012759270.1 hypothetical protein SAMD00019534_003830 [Acytostelium subglobosum LB1]
MDNNNNSNTVLKEEVDTVEKEDVDDIIDKESNEQQHDDDVDKTTEPVKVSEADSEVYLQGKELVQQSKTLLDQIKEMESGKDLFKEGNAIVEAIVKREEAKQLMEKGMALLTQVKENDDAKKIIAESKEMVTFFTNEEKVKSLLHEGKQLLENIKSKDATVTREQVESLFKQGSTLLKDFKDNEQSSLYLEKMKKMFFDLKEEESTRIKLMAGLEEGKKWVENLKANDPYIKSIVDEGEQIFLQLKNSEEFNSLIGDGKNVLMDFLTDENKHFSRDSPELLSLLQRGGKLASNVQETLKSNKLVGELTEKEDFKNILAKGNKFVSEVKSKQQLLDFLKQNKDFIKEIKNTIVPFITDQLLKVQMPVVTGINKGFNYELSDLIFAGLRILPENVNVDFDEVNKSITVAVNDFTAQLKNFSWSYKQDGFPFLKDTGLASADVQKGCCSLSFEIDTRPDTNTPEIKITEIKFILEHLEIVVGKGKAKWLYNYLISKFSESIKNTVETKIKNTISTHLNTLTGKINTVVGEYWEKLMTKLKGSPTSPNKIQELDDANANANGEGVRSPLAIENISSNSNPTSPIVQTNTNPITVGNALDRLDVEQQGLMK